MYSVSDETRKPIFEGVQGENEAREIQFDVTAWVEELGEGVCTATAKRPTDTTPYPVTVTRSGNVVTWKPNSTDTSIEGIGAFQLSFSINDVVAKTRIWNTKVAPSLVGAGDPPDPYDDWIQDLRDIAAETLTYSQNAEESADAAAASAASVAGVTSEVENIRIGADGATYANAGDAVRGQVSDLNSDISYGLFNGENLYDTTVLGVNNNTAVTNNGDGTFTFGTSDYGNTVIGKKVSLKAGCYKLYGVPQGTAHLGATYRLADAIVRNDSSNPKVFTLTADADLFLAFSILAKPSSAFTIRPYLCQTKVVDNTRQIAESNAKNLFLINDKEEETDSGITYSVKDNVYTMTGSTGSSLWFTNLYNSAQKLPPWCVAGNRVYVQFDAEGEYDGALLQMYKYVNGALTLMFGMNESGYYTIPSDFDGDGLLIRIRISASTSVDFRVRIGILSTMSNDELAKKTHKRAFSHNVVFFGDSIMWGRNGDGNSTDRTPFAIPNTVATALALKTANYGVGGMGFISNSSSPQNAYDKISNTDLTDFDTIVMCFGVNDGFNPIGTWDSTDESTCLGQFNKIVNYIYQQKTSVRLIVIAPFNGRNVGTFPKYWYGTVPSTAYSRGALSDALKQACEYYNIPYIEQTNSPINGFTIQTLIGADGVHPSNEGYKRLGEWIAGEVAILIG